MAAETGTPDGKVGKSRCEGCSSPHREEQDAALISPTSTLAEIVSRFGGSTSALSRHRRHLAGAIVRATARTVSPPPEIAEIEAYEDRLIRQMRTLQGRSLSLLDDAEKGEDGRLRAVAIAQVRENIIAEAKLTRELTPGDTTPAVEVRFVFGSPETQRYAEAFEARQERQRVAATASEAAGPASAMPPDDEAAQ